MATSYLDKDGLLYFLQKIRANATPAMDGTAATGTAKRFALQDHVHPTDTSRAPLASPALTGTPTAPTASTGTSTTQIATTEFVANTVGAMTSGVSDVKIGDTSIVSSGVATIPESSSSATGLMTSTQYSKLDGIASGAEVNQNAFSNVVVGSTTLAADTKTDTLTITAGDNVTLTPTASSDSFSIAATDTTYSNATSSAAGLMSASDKTHLDTVYTNAITVSGSSTEGVAVVTGGGAGYTLLDTGQKGIAYGVCPLNASTKIDSTYLPSYVDDVIEAYNITTKTPLASDWLRTSDGAITPESGKVYVIVGSNDGGSGWSSTSDYLDNQYRWGGTTYVKLSDGGVSAITNAEIDTIVAS